MPSQINTKGHVVLSTFLFVSLLSSFLLSVGWSRRSTFLPYSLSFLLYFFLLLFNISMYPVLVFSCHVSSGSWRIGFLFVFFLFFFLIFFSILLVVFCLSIRLFAFSFFRWWSPLAIQSGVMILSDLKRSAAVVSCVHTSPVLPFDSSAAAVAILLLFFSLSLSSLLRLYSNCFSLSACWLRLTFLGVRKMDVQLRREWDPPLLFFFTTLRRFRHFVRVFHHFSIHLISGVKKNGEIYSARANSQPTPQS